VLSDAQIEDAIRWRGLSISSFDRRCLQPASYDVHLHPELLILRAGGPLDPKVDTAAEFERVSIDVDSGFVLEPGMFALGSTTERVDLGPQLMGQLEGKSSLGRLGLVVHSTAGYLDPGFRGQITLELACVQGRGLILYPGMPIAQVAFMSCSSVAQLYQGKYVEQDGPTASRYNQNWDGEQWVA
jgi:dCTP deaminase